MNYMLRVLCLVILGTLVTIQQIQSGGRIISWCIGRRVPTYLDDSIKKWIMQDGRTMAQVRLIKNGYTDEAIEKALTRVERTILRDKARALYRMQGPAITHEAAIAQSKRKKKSLVKLAFKK